MPWPMYPLGHHRAVSSLSMGSAGSSYYYPTSTPYHPYAMPPAAVAVPVPMAAPYGYAYPPPYGMPVQSPYGYMGAGPAGYHPYGPVGRAPVGAGVDARGTLPRSYSSRLSLNSAASHDYVAYGYLPPGAVGLRAAAETGRYQQQQQQQIQQQQQSQQRKGPRPPLQRGGSATVLNSSSATAAGYSTASTIPRPPSPPPEPAGRASASMPPRGLRRPVSVSQNSEYDHRQRVDPRLRAPSGQRDAPSPYTWSRSAAAAAAEQEEQDRARSRR